MCVWAVWRCSVGPWLSLAIHSLRPCCPMKMSRAHTRYCAEVLPLINHMTFWGELNDLAGAYQVERADAGEFNCIWSRGSAKGPSCTVCTKQTASGSFYCTIGGDCFSLSMRWGERTWKKISMTEKHLYKALSRTSYILWHAEDPLSSPQERNEISYGFSCSLRRRWNKMEMFLTHFDVSILFYGENIFSHVCWSSQ